MNEVPRVYLVLGAPGAGRREVVADLLEDGLIEGDRPAVLLAATEAPDPADVRLGEVVRWAMTPEGAIDATWPPEATVGFFVMNGTGSPVDQIEAFKPWMQAQGVELGRVICVMHCRLAAAHDRLLAWYDACVHFSDVVLLNRRDGVDNKWISDLRTRYTKQCLPCVVEMVRKGRVHNPALVLDLQARRMSHWFDDEAGGGASWATGGDADTIFRDDSGDDEGEEGEESEEPDIYLARHLNGRRVREVPDIAEILAAES